MANAQIVEKIEEAGNFKSLICLEKDVKCRRSL